MARPTLLFALSVLIAIGFTQGKPRGGGHQGHGNSNSNSNSNVNVNSNSRRSNSNMNVNKNHNIFNRRGLDKFRIEDDSVERASADFRPNCQDNPKKSRASHRQLSPVDELVEGLKEKFAEEFGEEAAEAFADGVEAVRKADSENSIARPSASRRNLNQNQNSNVNVNSNSNSFGARPEKLAAVRRQKKKQEAQRPVPDDDDYDDDPTNIDSIVAGMLNRDDLLDFGNYFDDDEDSSESSELSEANVNSNTNINQNVNHFGTGGGSPYPELPSLPTPPLLEIDDVIEEDVDLDNANDAPIDDVKVDNIDYGVGNGDDYGIGIEDSEEALPEPQVVRRPRKNGRSRKGKKKRSGQRSGSSNANSNSNSNSNLNQFRRTISNLRKADIKNAENYYPGSNSHKHKEHPKNQIASRRNMNKNGNKNINSNINTSGGRPRG